MSRWLRIHAVDVTAEISVLDGRFEEVVAGIHSLEREMPRGLYKVRVRVGPNLRERLVSLDADRALVFGPAEFPSPLPFRGTSKTVEHQVRAAIESSLRRNGSFGEGGSAFVFVRDLATAEEDGGRERNPLIGLTFRRCGDPPDHALDVAALADVRMEGPACAGWCVSAAPGLYILASKEPEGRVLERTVFVSAGLQTQIFLMRGPSGPKGGGPVSADLATAAVAISAAGRFLPDDRQRRLAELARYALTHDRKVLSAELREILCGKFDDPMLGLTGLHLLLRDEPGDSARIDAVTENLSRVLGPDHPDLRALALRSPRGASSGAAPITAPPMLKAGWDMVVAASTRRSGVIAEQSPAAAVATRVLPAGPWLTWTGGGPGVQADRELVLVDILADYVRSRAAGPILAVAPVAPQARAQPRSGNAPIIEQAERIARAPPGFDAFAKEVEESVRVASGPPGPRTFDDLVPIAKAALVSILSEEEKADLSRILGLPSEVLGSLLDKVSS